MKQDEVSIQEITKNILASKKYRGLGLNPATIADLIHQEMPKHVSQRTLLKAVRRRLHNIVAPYLGEPNYQALSEELINLPAHTSDSQTLKSFCQKVLAEHASTRERLPYLEEFYMRLFEKAGQPDTILDLACGLHPLGFPWMGLPVSVNYHAYDIIQPRVDFLNLFFRVIGLAESAENRDILVDPPNVHADLGIFFKEAHRFEKRQPGCNRSFWASLDMDRLAISLPTQNLSGTHSLLNRHRKLVLANLPDHFRLVDELRFQDEVVFLVENLGGPSND
jgi:16S rRNA (guanine(1405)-N(7))-methyltransferase